MKGIVFTEFLDFVQAVHDADMVDDIIDDAHLPHGGSFTSVGTYPFTEMQALVVALSLRTKTSAPDLLKLFGDHLCRRFVIKYPEFFTSQTCLFDFLESVDRHIHVEVHKLYPDAELPTFRTSGREEHSLSLDYASCRPLEALAEGMIRAAADYFGEPIAITRSQIEESDEKRTRFAIRHAA